MSTIYVDLSVDTDEVIDNVSDFEEEDFLLEVLERFDRDNVNAALREHFGSRAERGESIPDFIDPTKL